MEQEPQTPMTNTPGTIRPWLLIVLIAVAVGAAGYFSWYAMAGPGKKAEPTPTVSTSSTPTTSTTVTLNNNSNGNSGNPKVDEPTPPTETGPTSDKPELNGVYTYDNDANGKIDEINVQFKNYDLDKTVTSVRGFTIDGYSVSSDNGSWNSFGTYSPPDSRASLPVLSIALKESATFDTAATPVVKYDGSLGELKNGSGIKVETFSEVAIDKAGPVLVSAVASDANNKSGIQDGDKVTLTFSEPIVMDPPTSISKLEAQSTYSNMNNIDEQFALSGGHTWFSGEDLLKSITQSSDKKVLVVALSVWNGVPTIAVGDSITASSSYIRDTADGASLTGGENAVKITGSF